MIRTMSDSQNPLRLRKKHGSGKPVSVTPDDGRRLLDAQSFRSAIVAALIVITVFSLFWITLSELTNRVFPWLTVVLGFLLGHAIRLAGKGTDWRFPVLASVLAVAGALFANIAVSGSVTSVGFGVGKLDVLSAVTSMTWHVFFDKTADQIEVV